MTGRHFETGGAAYARARPSYPPALAAALAILAPSRRLAVDVGCGSGQFSVLLADHFDAVLASDVSADQLANAAPRGNLSYVQAPAEEIDAPDGSAALITAAQAAHWFDLPRFYAEARRVAEPGGLLALISYGVMRIDGAPDARFQRFYWDEIHPYWPPERRHVETGYAAFDFPFDEIETPARAIERDWDLPALLGYVRTWSAARAAIGAGAERVIERFEKEMAAEWGAPDRALRVSFPISLRLGRLG